jgi:hypothetical protein
MSIPKTRDINEIERSRVYYFGDTFETIKDALALLGKKPTGHHGTKEFGNKKLAWFPKIAVIKKGALVPQTDEYKWINMVSSDGSEVLQMFSGEGEPKEGKEIFYDLSVERAIFAKLTNEQMYTFLGVFKKIPEKGINNTQVYQRISLDLSIDEWIEVEKEEE